MAMSMAASLLCVLLCVCSLQTQLVHAKKEKISLSYYLHEIRGGPSSTVLNAAGTDQGKATLSTAWGAFQVFDDTLKTSALPSSAAIGRATGTATITTIGGLFTGGAQLSAKISFGPGHKYSGSTLSIVGTVAKPLSPPWELVVEGGTGAFRGYAGYLIISGVPTNAAVSAANPFLVVHKHNVYLDRIF